MANDIKKLSEEQRYQAVELFLQSQIRHGTKEKLPTSIHLQNDLGMSSLDKVTLLYDMEQEFNIVLSDDDADNRLETLDDLIRLAVKSVNNNLKI